MKKIVSACVVIAVVMGSGAVALAAPSERGRWDDTPAKCNLRDKSDSFTEIDAKNLTGIDSKCSIVKRLANGNVVTLRLKCSDEGNGKPTIETWTLQPGDSTMAVHLVRSSEKPRSFKLYRCK